MSTTGPYFGRDHSALKSVVTGELTATLSKLQCVWCVCSYQVQSRLGLSEEHPYF